MSRIALSILVVSLLFSSGTAWGRRMPRGSFLVSPAYSAAQLATQIRTNPAVAQRYTIHFGVPASSMAEYAQAQLGLRPLPRAGKYRVFFIQSDGRIIAQVRYLPKGTPVFMHLRSAQPVLLGKCGNPMTARLPGYAPSRVTVAPTQTPQPPVVTPPQEPPPVEPPTTTMLMEMPEVPPIPPMETVTLSLWQADPSLSPLAPEAPAAANTRPNLIPLLLVGLLGLVDTGGKPAAPPPVIPEPASVGSLAVGVVLLVAATRRRKTR